MILIPCPHCGPRNSDEFRYSGEEHRRPDPAATTPRQWRDYLYGRDNPAGWVREHWYHVFGCRRFFTLERETVSNAVRPVTSSGSRGAETAAPGADTAAPRAETAAPARRPGPA